MNVLNKIDGMDIYFFNAKLGIISFIKGIEYFKYIEVPLVINNLDLREGCKVLDVGSGKYGLLPLFLVYHRKYIVYITDFRDYVFEHLELLKKKKPECLLDNKLVVEKQDIRNLTYPNNFFDKVTAVCAIEHIPADGDSRAMVEIARVLKKKGIAIVTVPFRHKKYKEVFLKQDPFEKRYLGKPVFYERFYDKNALRERLIEPSGLELRKIEYFGQRYFDFYGKLWERLPTIATIPLRWLMPLFSKIFCSVIQENNIKKANGACLVFEKT